MPRIILYATLLFAIGSLPATLLSQDVNWAQTDPYYLTTGSHLTADHQGGVIATGYGAFQTISSTKAYVVRIDTAGHTLWRDSIATTTANRYHHTSWSGKSPDGKIWVLGYRYILSSTSQGFYEVPDQLRIWKYDLQGNRLMDIRLDGSFGSGGVTPFGNGVQGVFDDNGNFYIATAGKTSSMPAGTGGYLLIKLTPNGQVVWDTTYTFGNIHGVNHLAYSNGRIAVSGATVFSNFNHAEVVWDTTGKLLWAKTAGDTDDTWATDLAIDAQGNTYTLATAAQMVNGVFVRMASLTKRNLQGDTLFYRTYPEGTATISGRMALLPNGNIALTATNYTNFSGPFALYAREVSAATGHTLWTDTMLLPQVTNRVYDLAVAPGGTFYVTGKSDNNAGAPAAAFTAAFNGQGLQWSDTYDSTFVQPMQLALDSRERPHLVGNNLFSVIQYENPAAGGVVNQTTQATICQGDVYSFRGNAYSTAGTYHDTVAGSGLYDTVFTLQLAVVPRPDDGILQQGDTLIAKDTGAALQYSWIDCQNGQVIQTGRKLVLGKTTTVQLAVSNGTCTDTSDCQTFIPTGYHNTFLQESVKVFPNPANEQIVIQGIPAPGGAVWMTNLAGQVMWQREGIVPETIIQVSEWPAGLYLLRISAEQGKTITKKVMIID